MEADACRVRERVAAAAIVDGKMPLAVAPLPEIASRPAASIDVTEALRLVVSARNALAVRPTGASVGRRDHLTAPFSPTCACPTSHVAVMVSYVPDDGERIRMRRRDTTLAHPSVSLYGADVALPPNSAYSCD